MPLVFNIIIIKNFRYNKEQQSQRKNELKEAEMMKQKHEEKKAIEAVAVKEPLQPMGLPGTYYLHISSI